ncbi:MAG: hypothetical protein HQL12_03035 [Candidatus Omnitrophica bacterium]|nr:hypothetical protein [Candidatus Omnitrophota bacterium]
MIFNLDDGMKRIDVPENHAKNNLPIGTVLQLNGYDNPKFCIIKNLGLTPGFEGHGAKYEVIKIEDGCRSIKNTLGLDHISTKKDDRIALYYTDAVLSADEIMDLIKMAEQKQAADIKAKSDADQARAKELDDLKRDYKHLEQAGESGKSSLVIAARNIRKELKTAFLGVKFSVRSESYSMGCSIHIGWTDGPLTDEVEAVVNKYEYGTFDSMTDCAGSIDSQFIDLYGGARFVSPSRGVSDEAFNKVAVKMGYSQAVFNPKSGQFDGIDYDINEMIKREAWKTKF